MEHNDICKQNFSGWMRISVPSIHILLILFKITQKEKTETFTNISLKFRQSLERHYVI
jgi:hypothetical protein